MIKSTSLLLGSLTSSGYHVQDKTIRHQTHIFQVSDVIINSDARRQCWLDFMSRTSDSTSDDILVLN